MSQHLESAMNHRVLICITTANQWLYTKMALESLWNANVGFPYDVLIIDDASDDATVELCAEFSCRVISKSKAMGVTDSWNRAYREFIDGNYDSLIIANNDVLIPRGALEELVVLLKSYPVVGPMSSKIGVGSQPLQAVNNFAQFAFDENKPENVQLVQDQLIAHPTSKTPQELPFVNGFFFALSRRIQAYQLEDGNLFRPDYVNVGNEDELCSRLNEPIAVCPKSFIFHFKGVSFAEHRICGELVYHRDWTWQEARNIRNHHPIVHRLIQLNHNRRQAIRWLKVRLRKWHTRVFPKPTSSSI